MPKESTQFKPGNRGRPHGSKNKHTLEIRELIDAAVSKEDWQAIIAKQVELAKNGDEKAIKFLAEYRFGKPTQTIIPEGGEPIKHEHSISQESLAALTALGNAYARGTKST